MATDNRNGPALFPDVTEQYESEPSAESAVAPPVPIAADPNELVPEVRTLEGPAPEERAPGRASEEPASDFEHRPTWLAEPQVEPELAQRARRSRRPVVVAAAAASLLAVVGAVTAVVVTAGGRETAGSAVPVAGSSTAALAQDTAAVAPGTSTAWCADAVSEGRSVGSGPGTVDNGPGAIRAFDHAYYAERDGARVASLMVTPNPVPEIQKWIDDVPVGTEHCVTIASTPDPNAYEVDLRLRMPDGTDGTIRQRITVAASPAGFKVATVEDLR
ncbi:MULTISPECIES: hypothetical protein [Rhodococcus]|uniref:DUF8176 domain-containing protein n=1 Tax=Rhodococcus parequi TaxID=3137122 RepID=A0ABW9FFZ2_9NOCA